MKPIYCGICRRHTQSDGARCLSCNTPQRKARAERPRIVPQCKKCGSSAVAEIEPLRFECRGCSSIFGVDDQPITIETMIMEQPDRRQGGRHHRSKTK